MSVLRGLVVLQFSVWILAGYPGASFAEQPDLSGNWLRGATADIVFGEWDFTEEGQRQFDNLAD